MKIIKDGKEVTNGQIIYTPFGTVDTVMIDGVHYAAEAFEFKDEEVKTKTKTAHKKASKATKK